MIDEARLVYSHLRTLGLPDPVTFEGFLSVYTLGLDGSEKRPDGFVHTKPIVRSKSGLHVETNNGREDKTGRWKEVLDNIAESLVGRSEAARVRASTLKGMALFEDQMKIADSKRERLYRILGSVQKEQEIENKQLMDLDKRKKQLEKETEHKRQLILLLNVLEKREGFRMKRIGSIHNGGKDSDERHAGIADLMKRLRWFQISRTVIDVHLFLG